jgi:signal peptidase I
MDSTSDRPSPWPALAFALVLPGLGHVNAGRVRAGIVVFVVWIACLAALSLGVRTGPAPAVAGLSTMVLFWIAQTVHAGVVARRARAEPTSWLTGVAGFLLLFAMGTATGIGAALALRRYVAQTFVMPTGSMLPALESGDVFVIAPGAPIERGAVVVHAAPPGSRQLAPLLKRVVAVGGDTVEVRDGRLLLNGESAPGEELAGACTYWAPDGSGDWVERACRARTETLGSVTYRVYCTPDQPCGDVAKVKVPPGHVFVLGDHRDNSAVSRVYGPVPEASILGRARWIYFSIGPHGVRTERVGMRVE